MAGYDYGGTRPDQITVNRDRGLSLGDTLDAAMKRMTAPSTPAVSAPLPTSVGYGMNTAVAPPAAPPSPIAPSPTLLQPKPKEPPSLPVPGSLAGALTNAGTPQSDVSRSMPPDRQSADLTQRGDSLTAQAPLLNAESAVRQGGGSLIDVMPQGVNPGQRVVAQNSAPTGQFSRTADGWTTQKPELATNYSVYGVNGKQGTASIVGPDQRAGNGTLSVMDQGNGGTVEGNVAAINRQTEALRSLREARNPGITTGDLGQVQEPKAPDMFARPGDGNGDSQKRQQEYEGLLREAANQTGWGASKRAAAKTAAAQSLIEPGMAAAKAQQEQQAAQGSLAGHLAQADATRYGHILDSQNKAREFGLQQQNYELNQQKAGVDQQTAQAQQALHAVNALKGMSEVQRETSMNALLDQIQKTDSKSPEYERLSRIYMLAKRGTEPKADPLTSLMQSQ